MQATLERVGDDDRAKTGWQHRACLVDLRLRRTPIQPENRGPVRLTRTKTILGFLLGVLLAGCATTGKINWDARVNEYTFDQAVMDYGPPDKAAKLADGTQVCEWLLERGSATGGFLYHPGSPWVHRYAETPSPDSYLRLTFTPAGKLGAWKKVWK